MRYFSKQKIRIYFSVLALLLALIVFYASLNYSPLKAISIAVGADVHLVVNSLVQTEAFDYVMSDMADNNLVEMYIIVGDWSGYRYSDFDYAQERFNEFQSTGIHLELIDGNHEWDEFTGSDNIYFGSSERRLRWVSDYPYVESWVIYPADEEDRYIFVKDTTGFSVSEKTVAIYNPDKNSVSLNEIGSIEQKDNIIILSQELGSSFPARSIVMQGRNSKKFIAKLKEIMLADSDAETLSRDFVYGNNVLILLSLEDFFQSFSESQSGQMILRQNVLDWLELKLAEHIDKNVFIFSHWPVGDTGIYLSDVHAGRSFDQATTDSIKKLLNEYKVAVWFSGHVHLNPDEPGKVQSNQPEGFGGCTFIHIPSTGARKTGSVEQTTPYNPYWRYFELIEGEQSILIKTRNSKIRVWLNEEYNINVALPFRITLQPLGE